LESRSGQFLPASPRRYRNCCSVCSANTFSQGLLDVSQFTSDRSGPVAADDSSHHGIPLALSAATCNLLSALAISFVRKSETADFCYPLTYPLLLLSLPPTVSQIIWPFAATRQGLHHFRQDQHLSGLTVAVDMDQITGGLFSSQALSLLVLLSGSLQKRSSIEAALMMLVVQVTVFAANMTSGIVLLAMKGGPGGTPHSAAMYLLTTLLMLLPAVFFLLSAEAALVGLTAPIPLREPADSKDGKSPSLRSICSPLVYWWNSLEAAMPMDPLPCESRTDFQLPRPLQALYLWLSPVVITAQCIRLIF